jgi:hypothetical protein
VLGTRADLVLGRDALIEVTLPPRAALRITKATTPPSVSEIARR